MYKNKYSGSHRDDVFFAALMDIVFLREGLVVKVPVKTIANNLEDWKKTPAILNHSTNDDDIDKNDERICGKIVDVFINTEGFIGVEGNFVEANYLPIICILLEKKIDKPILGVSNEFEFVKVHIERDGGMDNVVIADQIRPRAVAVLTEQMPNFKQCSSLQMNSDGNNKLNKYYMPCEIVKEKKKNIDKNNIIVGNTLYKNMSNISLPSTGNVVSAKETNDDEVMQKVRTLYDLLTAYDKKFDILSEKLDKIANAIIVSHEEKPEEKQKIKEEIKEDNIVKNGLPTEPKIPEPKIPEPKIPEEPKDNKEIVKNSDETQTKLREKAIEEISKIFFNINCERL